jgi:hypothetical protein
MKGVRSESTAAAAPVGAASVSVDDLIGSDEAAKRLRIAPATLVTWRSEKRGPCFIKVGRAVLYSPVDIETWLRAQRRDPKVA